MLQIGTSFHLNFSWKFHVSLFSMLIYIFYWASCNSEWYLCALFQLSFFRKTGQPHQSVSTVHRSSKAVCWQSNGIDSCILQWFSWIDSQLNVLAQFNNMTNRVSKVKANCYFYILPLENKNIWKWNFFSSRKFQLCKIIIFSCKMCFGKIHLCTWIL